MNVKGTKRRREVRKKSDWEQWAMYDAQRLGLQRTMGHSRKGVEGGRGQITERGTGADGAEEGRSKRQGIKEGKRDPEGGKQGSCSLFTEQVYAR